MPGPNDIAQATAARMAVQPPCRAACPAHVDVPAYVSLVAEGRFDEALAVILESNPLPGVCGRACMHPCQDQCRRGELDDPVAISTLKRAAADYGTYPDRRPSALRDESVAIIGAGPAGLTAAYDLGLLGYRVTIFEQRQELGGVLRYSIPPYRIPTDVLKRDIDHILSVGIDVVTGKRIGEDLPFEQLRADFDAIVVAPGLQLSRMLPIPGSDLAGIIGAMPFLSAVNEGERVELGKRVVVVGGGNVAIDAARCALRCGAEEVRMVCLERRDVMPANPWEVDAAEQEGVRVIAGWGPREVLGKGRHARALRAVACTSIYREDGRFDPVFDEELLLDVPADTVIVAIGQAADLEGLDVPRTARGLLEAAPVSAEGHAKMFSAGDAVYGAKRIIDAVAAGHRVAARLHAEFSGTAAPSLDPEAAQVSAGDAGEGRTARAGAGAPEGAAATPLCFEEAVPGFDRAMAEREAQRCLSCATASECPLAAAPGTSAAAGASVSVATLAVYAIDAARCTGCHACVRSCPAGAISGEAKQPHRIDPALCVGCGACVERCKPLAISELTS